MAKRTADPEMIFDMAAEEAELMGSEYRDVYSCRDDLYDFMDANGWFGLECEGNGHDLRVHGLLRYKDRVLLWIKAYGRTDTEKYGILMTEYRWKFPVLCSRFRAYVKENGCAGEARTWQTLDYLIASSEEDIDRWDDRRTIELVKGADRYCTKTASIMAADFLAWNNEQEGEGRYEYMLPERRIGEADNSAYETYDFITMAYCVFNEDSWKENRMIEKACMKAKYAGLWIFTALHFICGIRASDMKKLPVPKIPFAGETMREKILEDSIGREAFAGIASGWQSLISLLAAPPNKTSGYSGIADIKVFIPESLMEPVGLIVSIAASYAGEDGVLVYSGGRKSDYKAFFGEQFIKASGNKSFSTRRANKSYLQGIEKTADIESGGGKIKGYMMASLARSHKGGYGTLSEITDIYLKDAAFSGYRPEFILKEMFDRGIFGFIPVMLLERYGGDEFRKLDVHSQTVLIKEIGLSSMQIERITEAVGEALERASESVKEIMEDVCAGKKETSRILQSIASGDAGAKQDGYLCLRNAAGLPCPKPERSGCLGCGYEVYTKAALHILMSEYKRLNGISVVNADDRCRCRKILEKAVMPAVWEIVGSVRMLYPDEDITCMLDVIERGISDAGCDRLC